jgi:hypothetical protein
MNPSQSHNVIVGDTKMTAMDISGEKPYRMAGMK